MVKVNFVTARHKRRKKILKLAKGYFGSKSILYKTAHEQVMRSLQYAYRDRRQKKRNLRKLWITRISAGCLNNDIRYSQFIHGLLLSKIEINRKMLADMVHNEPKIFSNYVDLSKKVLENKKNIKKIELQKQEELKETKSENEKNINQEKQEKELDLNSKLLPELRTLAKKYKIQNVSKLKKVNLIHMLENIINKK
ncbi:LSU ribosomal protein L20p [Candidatus Phytoplasma rubi]|uniref:Large ribosomal subunit protein bL20 n=1 Tax=Candidatus Phytoplasma rubi TaxID=399025 RepID=A0ABY7BTL9_9MOLU|nr:50S ribosomal protein L20 [Candidatus Phytoplasma rubi]WAN63648.1 LSU ribosomal protein L20p [Candidatus Phytoplasma rubi]